jgi:hypothetical protein
LPGAEIHRLAALGLVGCLGLLDACLSAIYERRMCISRKGDDSVA